METLAGNDDDDGDDNSSSGTEGAGGGRWGKGGWWFPGRIRLASTRSSRGRASAKRDRYAKTTNPNGSLVCAK